MDGLALAQARIDRFGPHPAADGRDDRLTLGADALDLQGIDAQPRHRAAIELAMLHPHLRAQGLGKATEDVFEALVEGAPSGAGLEPAPDGRNVGDRHHIAEIVATEHRVPRKLQQGAGAFAECDDGPRRIESDDTCIQAVKLVGGE